MPRFFEFLPAPLPIVGLVVPGGAYDYGSGWVSFNFGRQRRLSGNVMLERGTFYSGHKTTLTIGQGRLNVTPQLSIEPTYLGNWVDLAEGASIRHLVGSRVTYTMTPTMFVSALLQYNTGIDAVSANVRLRWEYRPGSELFVVFNEQRDTVSPRFPDLMNRAVTTSSARSRSIDCSRCRCTRAVRYPPGTAAAASRSMASRTRQDRRW